MLTRAASNKKLKCSFCGRSQDDVGKLAAGPDTYICDQCVRECQQVMAGQEIAKKQLELLEMTIDQSNYWLISRVIDQTGITVQVNNNKLGSSMEEKLLVSAALDQSVEEKLVTCLVRHDTTSLYQLTWCGLNYVRAQQNARQEQIGS